MSALLRRSIVVALPLVLLLGACGRGPRPDPDEWQDTWDSMLAVVPSESDLGSPPNEQVCQSALRGIREHSEDLIPSPSVTVDDLANEWVTVAERSFFECPPDGQDITSFDDAYEEMARIEQAIAAALSS